MQLLSKVIILCFFASIVNSQSNEKYNVYKSGSDSLQINYLLKRLNDQFEIRRHNVERSLESKRSLLNRQNGLREWYKNTVGKLPEKTQLNTVVTKKKEYENYIIEWVAFESQPNHHVTGMLYLPKKGKVPYPAVYIPCGHSVLGKGGETYQKAARLFALNGFVVLVSDPICQGERMQYLDEQGKQITEERMLMHEILGQKLLLTGSNTLIHELWDNIRCLDFLEQHSLVDKNRLAVAGNSGGGTQTTYLVAFDDRVKVATPSCYIATSEKKFNTIGSQDGCQQLWGEGEAGVEEQDFLLMAAPKPIRILSAEDDFFNIDGARAAYAELKKIYTILGIPDKIDQVVVEGKHGWHKSLREASVQWCRKWLMNDDSPVIEPENIGCFENKEDCQVTNTGQVLTSFEDEKSVSDLIRDRLNNCEKNRKEFLNSHSPEQIIKAVKKLIGYEEVSNNLKHTFVDSFTENGYKSEKYFLERDSKYGVELPCLLFTPTREQSNTVTIIISEFGKSSEHTLITREIKKGNIVLALDVSNTGELKDNRLQRYNNKEFWVGKLPIYEGKTLLAYRVEDILTAKQSLKQIVKQKIDDINLISVGLTGPAALHAVLLDNEIKNVELINSVESWEEIAASDYVSDLLGNVVPDVLNYYDMPDLLKVRPASNIRYIKDSQLINE